MKFMNVAAKYMADPMHVIASNIATVNIGQNFFNLLVDNVQWIVLGAMVVFGAILAWKREFTKLVVFAFIAIIAVVLVFNTTGVKDLMLEIGNAVLGL